MPGSEPDRDAFTPVSDLICPARDIFDGGALWAELLPVIDDASDAASVRNATVTLLRNAMKNGRSAIATALAKQPLVAYPAIASYAYLTDGIVSFIYRVAVEHLHPVANPTASERIALLAVGGYGRGEMAPQSDVDLLFLTPYKITPWAESVIESMLYMLWDLRLKVGHASRTIEDCLRLGDEDFTIRTALLEQRHICGDDELARKLADQLWKKLFKNTLAEFIEAKLAERDARHEKQGDQRFMVEPNVKEGKGGLRDLQTLYWVAKYQHRVREHEELVSKGLFT